MRRFQAVILALSLSSCTLLGGATGAGAAAVHNWDVPDDHSEDDWSKTTGFLIGASIGLVVDLVILFVAAKQWSKPLT